MCCEDFVRYQQVFDGELYHFFVPKSPSLHCRRTFSQVCRAVVQAGKNGCRSGTVMILAFLNGPFKAGEW